MPRNRENVFFFTFQHIRFLYSICAEVILPLMSPAAEEHLYIVILQDSGIIACPIKTEMGVKENVLNK